MSITIVISIDNIIEFCALLTAVAGLVIDILSFRKPQKRRKK